ncbi:hypothetical protein M407DRAFT_30044 [Tulasnella calospora MUT 4182]|uniref:Uncharacterized protein n=1 Tax=Tulasnella calospora MUT 4182 TaxID=1051891 RepID=A0A0C3Q812_9AGAM|nr:hypothetical protein M407DRAFT_30044 [Tulasnella calospora MUT 4182]
MAPIHPVRATALRQAQSATSIYDPRGTKPASPSQSSLGKTQGTPKSRSSSAPRPKSILATACSSTGKSPNSRHRVQFAENNDTVETDDEPIILDDPIPNEPNIVDDPIPNEPIIVDDPVPNEPIIVDDPIPNVPGFIWPFQFPDRIQLAEVCKAQAVDTLYGCRGVLSLEHNSLLREKTRRAPEEVVEDLCNHVFVQTFELLVKKQEAGAAINTGAELTEEVNRITDVVLPIHTEGFGVCNYHADLRRMTVTVEQENVFEHLGADDYSITNVNFFRSPKELQANNMGAQFIHENLNPV